MKTIIQYLSEYVSEAFHVLGYGEFGNVVLSNRPDLCQFQCDDSFQAAKANKKKSVNNSSRSFRCFKTKQFYF